LSAIDVFQYFFVEELPWIGWAEILLVSWCIGDDRSSAARRWVVSTEPERRQGLLFCCL